MTVGFRVIAIILGHCIDCELDHVSEITEFDDETIPIREGVGDSHHDKSKAVLPTSVTRVGCHTPLEYDLYTGISTAYN